MDDLYKKLMSGAGRIRLPGGIFGKQTYVIISFCAALATIGAAIHTPEIGYVAIGALTLIVGAFLWRSGTFAAEHPDSGTMDGIEILALQMNQAQKGKGEFPQGPAGPAHTGPALPQIDSQTPDTLLLEQPKPKRQRKDG